MKNILWGVRTYFSIGESILSPDSLFKRAAELGYTHVAVADVMSVTALIDSAKHAEKAGVELISGCTLRVEHWEKEGAYFQPKVYCCDNDAFVRLMQALSEATDINKQRMIKWDVFIAMLKDASFQISTGDAFSAFSSAFPSSDVSELMKRLWLAQRALHEDGQVVVELVGVNSPYYRRANQAALEYLSINDGPAIVSGMPLYERSEDAEARDVMHAICRNLRQESGARQILEHTDFSMKSSDELQVLAGFSQVSDEKFSERLTWRWSKAPISLPKMAEDEFAELVKQCKAGWGGRIEASIIGYQPDKSLIPAYVDRLKMELGVLRDLGFCGYFLLVADLVRWAKANDITVGPGRGSVGGSLVAFVLGITDVDPIRFNLLFERFISPDRIDLPDADLDFMSERRHEVVEYLRDKYGAECVAQISNYNTLGPTSAIGEVGKFFGIPDRETAFRSYLPKEHGFSTPLKECEVFVPELQEYMAKYPKEYAISLRLEGQLRSLGTHAAGVIVAAEPIKNRATLAVGGSSSIVNWDKRIVEDQGLVKIDALGLTNLDLIGRALSKIEKEEGVKLKTLDIPLDDEKTLEAFGEGETPGVFQFESSGMRKLLKDLRKGGPLSFDDLAAATALFRPGPLDSGMTEEYVAVKQNVIPVDYGHPAVERATGETNGVMIYQENIMALMRDISGYSMVEADSARKFIGKKLKDKLKEMKPDFVKRAQLGKYEVELEDRTKVVLHGSARVMTSDGELYLSDAVSRGIEFSLSDPSSVRKAVSTKLVENGTSAHHAEALWAQIETAGNYSFNASHACAYSIVSVWTQYLRVHHPHQFYAAALEVFKEDKLQGIVADAAKRGIRILPPDINESTSEFRRFGDDLLAPLNRIRGFSEITEKAVLEAREKAGGRFNSEQDLIDNVEKRRCNARQRKILEEVGAFASITPGALPATHPDRTKVQLEMLPGLILASVRAERFITIDSYVQAELTSLYHKMREEGAIVLPRFGKKPKMVVLLEAPTFRDEKKGKLMETDTAHCIKEAIKAAGLSMADVYCTTYIKKPKSGKTVTAEELTFSKPYFAQEMELLKPPVIVALGSVVARELNPDLRGSIVDMNGKIIYDKERDASIVLTISPGQVWHDPSKQALLNDAFSRAAELFD